MTRPGGGLGRGLGALIPAGPVGTPGPFMAGFPDGQPQPGGQQPGSPPPGAAEQQPVAGARFAEIPVDQITPNPLQPRTHFDDEAADELVASIREVGLLQPVVVRSIESQDGSPRFELVMGERRWRACRTLGMALVPAIVRDTSDDDMLRDALLENLHRQQLNPLEEAAAYQQLLAEFGATHEELAARIGRSRPQITNTIRLLQLPPTVQSRVAAGVLSAGHARAILGLDAAGDQETMATRAVAEGMSVRSVEEAVAMHRRRDEDDGLSGPRRTAKRPPAPELVEMGERLSDRFDTRVKVEMGRAKGKVTIEFASKDDLERIMKVLENQA